MKKRVSALYNKLRTTNILANFLNLGGIQVSNTLLIILVIPVITRSIGIAAFGVVMFANRFSQLAASFINWGTSQSGVKDVTFTMHDTGKLGNVFYTIFSMRIAIFAAYLLILFVLQWFNVDYYRYILYSIPIVLAEVFNPLYLFIGVEKLKTFNIYNLAFNVVCLITLFVLINGPGNAIWVNFILGMGNVVTYILLSIHFSRTHQLPFSLPKGKELWVATRNNFYLTINNVSVNLQQTIIIFALPRWGYAFLLGPYTLCDRIVGQCKNLLITISNAIYPNASRAYLQSAENWAVYRRKAKYLIAGLFFLGSMLLFVLADFFVFILTKEHNATAVLFLRVMAFVPTISALNVLNVLDQLLKNKNVNIFRIAIVLLVVAAITAFTSLTIGYYLLIGAFTFVVETIAWLLYEYVIRKTSPQHA